MVASAVRKERAGLGRGLLVLSSLARTITQEMELARYGMDHPTLVKSALKSPYQLAHMFVS